MSAVLARGVLAAALAAGLLAGCGGSDQPLPEAKSLPIGVTPEVTPTPGSSDSSPSPSGSATSSAVTVPGGSLVQGSGFTIRLPGVPEQSQQVASEGSAKITFDIYLYDGTTEAYTVTRAAYPVIGTLPTLHDALQAAADQADGKVATSSMLKYKHEPGIEGTITGAQSDGKDVTIFARYVVIDRVMIGMLYLDRSGGTTPPTAFRTFVESLAF
jgi:hypothetical protein